MQCWHGANVLAPNVEVETPLPEQVDPLLRCVCLDNGTPMAASRMDPTQHRTELGLKGRLVEGQDLYRAVLVSLGSRVSGLGCTPQAQDRAGP